MADNVTPLRRPSRPAAPATSPARQLARQQGAADRARYVQAQVAQEAQRLLATGHVVPARITLALDARGLWGPEVDTACGAAEPDVDRWELALAEPTPEQVAKLAALTRFPVAYFYRPLKPGPLLGGEGPIWVCYGGRRGCEALAQHVVDERGVLLYNGQPREIPPNLLQGALF